MAGNDNLSGTVEINCRNFFTLFCLFAGSYHLSLFQTNNGSHPTNSERNGALHKLPTLLHQTNGIRKIHDTGAGECGIFAKAMACHKSGFYTALVLPESPDGDRCGQYCGLSDMGLGEFFSGAALGQCPKIIAQDITCLRKGFFHQSERISQFREHAYFLGALPWKNKACMTGIHQLESFSRFPTSYLEPLTGCANYIKQKAAFARLLSGVTILIGLPDLNVLIRCLSI
jgi:hypothetical protein